MATHINAHNKNLMFTKRIKLSELARKITYLSAIIICAFSLLSLFGRCPYIELTTHFRLQYVLGSLICIVVLSFFRCWKIVPLAILSAVFNLYFVVPYYFAAPTENNLAAAQNVRFMLANVQGNNQNYSGLLEAVKANNPDVVVLEEVTDKWWENVERLTADYPNFKALPRPGGSGLAFFSRFPIEKAEVLTLDDSTHPALLCAIKIEKTALSIFIMHPPTPVTTRKFNYRNGQFARIAAMTANTAEPKMLIGDLNTTMWSPYFTDLLQDSGLRDARIGQGIYPNWHALLPAFLGIPIDHCLISEKIEVENIATGDYTGSDHRPLLIDLKVDQ